MQLEAWRSDFRRLWMARATSEVGSGIAALSLPLIALTVGGAGQAGAVLATGTIAQGAVTLLAGALVDRVSRRAAMIVSGLVRAAAFASIAVAQAVGGLTLAQLFVVAAVNGAAAPLFFSAETAAVRAIVPRDRLPLAYSRIQIRSTVADLVASPVGGVLYGLRRALPFATNAVALLVEAVLIAAIRTPLPAPTRAEATRTEPAKSSTRLRTEILGGLSFVWRHPFLRTSLVALGIINFASLLPVLIFSLHDRGISPSRIGLLLSVLTAVTLVGALVAPRLARVFSPGPSLIGGAWFLVAALVVATVGSGSVAVLIGGIAMGLLVVPAISVLLSSYEAAVTPDDLIGRVSSAGSLICILSAPAGQAVGAAVYSVAGVRPALGIFSGAIALGATLLTASRHVRGFDRLAVDI